MQWQTTNQNVILNSINSMNNKNNTPKIAGAFVVSGILLLGAYFALNAKSSDDSATTLVTSPTPVAITTNEAAAVLTPATYKSGTYTLSGSYKVPRGDMEPISITVAIVDDVVTDLQVKTEATSSESAKYQAAFGKEINAKVVGTSLKSVNASRVGGASLTSRAFNDLIEAARKDASI
jgi:hypothetical protein